MRKMSIIIVTLFASVGFVYAQGLSLLSNNVSRHAPSTASNHHITFTTQAGIANAGDTLTVLFEGGFDLSAITVSDIALSYGLSTGLENALLLAGTPSASEWGVNIGVNSLTLTHPTDANQGDIPSGNKIGIRIGTNAGGVNQIINPATEGSRIIRISTSTGEYGALAVPIAQDQIGVAGDVDADMTATIQWAVPELRVGATETNDDAIFYIAVLSADDNDPTVLFTQPALATLDIDGTYATPIDLTGVVPGTYDVIIKTHQHLSKKLNDITLVAGNNVLNFSSATNAPLKEAEVLLAGDINNTGATPSTLGDNVVNSVDISTLLTVLDQDDPTGNALRPNVNQDVVVNSVDVSILIKNLDLEGEL